MKWVTRAWPKTDRIACPWLIRTFTGPEAEILYVPASDVLAVAQREGAYSFDAPAPAAPTAVPSAPSRCSSTNTA